MSMESSAGSRFGRRERIMSRGRRLPPQPGCEGCCTFFPLEGFCERVPCRNCYSRTDLSILRRRSLAAQSLCIPMSDGVEEAQELPAAHY